MIDKRQDSFEAPAEVLSPVYESADIVRLGPVLPGVDRLLQCPAGESPTFHIDGQATCVRPHDQEIQALIRGFPKLGASRFVHANVPEFAGLQIRFKSDLIII
jgi:hypothetical protein